MDSKLHFQSHVTALRKTCFFQLKRLRAIRNYIPKSQFATLIHAFITSRLDFCNSIFYALPKTVISRLQTIQNSCAKCLTGGNRYTSATEARFTLHWLPITSRSMFKLGVMAHKVVHHPTTIPTYISGPCSTSKHICNTRNNSSNTLVSTFSNKL